MLIRDPIIECVKFDILELTHIQVFDRALSHCLLEPVCTLLALSNLNLSTLSQYWSAQENPTMVCCN